MKLNQAKRRKLAWALICIMIFNAIPAKMFALTGGPSQPEVETFQPIEVTDMVDPATGDFSYNIPLMEVGGYPINLIYNAGITMDQEASMVGLGWNINPGVITRSVRGIPDDFNGDKIEKNVDMKDNITWGVSIGGKFEFFGIDVKKYTGPQLSLNPSLGLSHNNYDGYGLEIGLTPAFTGGAKCMPGLGASLGLSASSKEGLGFSPNVSYSLKLKKTGINLTSISGQLGTNINSRSGMKELTYSSKFNINKLTGAKVNEETGSIELTEHKANIGGSGSLSYASTSYIPQIENPLKNESYTFSFGMAFENTGAFTGGSVTGYFSRQQLEEKSFGTASFGTAYLDEGKNKNGLLDFNREKDGSFTKEKPNLPIPYITNDIFSVNGQGIGGSYELTRGDIGVIYDKKARNTSSGYSLGLEAGPGNAWRLGGDIHTNFVNTYSGKWDEDIDFFDNINFHPPTPNIVGYESAFFKAAGEWSPFINAEENILTATGFFEAVKVKLDKSGSEVKSTSDLKSNSNSIFPVSGLQKRDHRSKRNQSISFLTASEASKVGLEKKIKDYDLLTGPSAVASSYSEIERVDANRAAHHISEITALRPDGLRYVFGIPAYNNTQYEICFNTNPDAFQANCNNGLVGYEPIDNAFPTPKHEYGIDHFLDQEKTPAFAHSYLLSAILSEDYVDLTGDGPSADDLGTYTKFNYSRIYEYYQWRIPYEQANYNPGFQSKSDDDKANFTYGEKEIWLLHSIESKTQIAEFYYGERKDSHGAKKYTGGRDNTMKLNKLERIVLYSTPDKIQNIPTKRTPIKSVYFEYDYSLCPGVETNIDFALNNGNNGKLTLKKVYFKYGLSEKGKFSPYQFKYSGDVTIPLSKRGINPVYNLKGYNRWGSFSYVNISNQTNDGINCNNIDRLTSSDFPFILQKDQDPFDEQEFANNCSSAWALKEIYLPSGGKISVDYEADDYAYVQDKEAMQLFEIVGTSSNSDKIDSDGDDLILYEGDLPMNYLFFKLSDDIPASVDKKSYIFSRYVSQAYYDRNLFFKVFANLDNNDHYEYVQGYTEIIDWGYHAGSNSGYIKLKTACTKDREYPYSSNPCASNPASPIAKTAWQFARLQLPRLVFGNMSSSSSSDSEVSEDANDFISVGSSFRSLFSGFEDLFAGGINNRLKDQSYAKTIRKGKSWIRLSNPQRDKLAGTHRVRKIVISDEWAGMTNSIHPTSTYGQEYEYDKNYEIDKDTLRISSGVAAYEPLIGSEENPFKLPITYHQENKMAPDDDYYLEGPLGESFFPSPTIIYSEVKVSNLQYEDVNKKATGWIVHKFFTAKEFPTLVSETTLDAYPKKTNPILKFFFKIKNQDYMTTSQGYAIELNDMHGKPESKEVFNQIGSKISGISYHYKTSGGKLSNTADLLMPLGQVKEGTIGVSYSIVADQREARTKIIGAGMNLNNDNFFIPFIPAPLLIPSFVPIPFFNSEKTRYRSVVVTKVIHRSGVLDYTTAYDLGSTVNTQNLVWDGITGEVLATKTFNEFEDPIYNFNYPAHWAYKGMGPAYKNINASFTPISFNNNEIEVMSNTYFQEGDEVLINNTTKAWVKTKISNNKIKLINFSGTPITSLPSSIKIIRSGHRNKSSTSIGSVVSLENPMGTSLVVNGSKKIINASAIEFDDKRNIYCCKPDENVQCNCTISDYKEHKFPSTIPESVLNDFFNNLNFNNISSNYTPMPGVVQGAFQSWMAFNRSNLDCIDTSICAIWDWRNSAYRYIDETDSDGKLYHTLYVKKLGVSCECKIRISVPSFSVYKIKINQWGVDISCSNCRAKVQAANFYLNGTVVNGYNEIKSTCFKIFKDCKDCCDPDLDNPPPGVYAFGNVFNPYTTNHLGTFTPKKSYTFLAQRKSTASNSLQPNLRNDGYFTNTTGNPYFSPFWQKPVGGINWYPNSINWTWTAEVTKIHPNGNELESRDRLYRYSSELLGFNDQMVIAVAGNARYGQCMFEGFEDYNYSFGVRPSIACPSKKYFEFPNIKVSSDKGKAHSGKYFLSIEAGKLASNSYKLSNSCYEVDSSNNPESGSIGIDTNCLCLPQFNPKEGKYVFSAWVNESRDPLIHNFDKSKCEVVIDGVNHTFKASGSIIEGWQRIYGEFQIPSGSSKITIKLIASPDTWTYFDDIRIHPFDASFKSFVYDDITLRFTYELDENNYFTKYEYDASGKLERVKKETEKGVMTIQETRFSNKKVN